MKPAQRSLILLVVQLALVSTIAGKYLYERQHCPRVWTRVRAYDPDLFMRGRYLSTQLRVNTCDAGWAQHAGKNYSAFLLEQKYGKIVVSGNSLKASSLEDMPQKNFQRIEKPRNGDCSNTYLERPVYFYLPEHAQSPLPLRPGQELWVEVTVPPLGPPRPIQLAVSQDGRFRPLPLR